MTGKQQKVVDDKQAMVPFFSRRSVVILIIGLVVGILLALGYWLISPAFSGSSTEEQTQSESPGFLGMLGIEAGPYQSTVDIQVVNPGTNLLSLSYLQQVGEYYAAKENSQAFFQYMETELKKYPFDNEYTIEELQNIIKTEYDYTSDLPLIILSATADTKEEASFFADITPQIFLDYLAAEENQNLEEQKSDISTELESVKQDFYLAQQEYNALLSPEILDNPEYIALKAKVDALQQEFNDQLALLTLDYGNSNINDEYDQTLQQIATVTTDLNKAEEDLQNASTNAANSLEDDAAIFLLDSKIRGLQNQLDFLMNGDTLTPGLIDYISNGIEAGTEYQNLMAKVELTSTALAEAQQEYDELVKEKTQKAAAISLDQRLAQIKVDTLSAELITLQETLANLYTQIISLNNGTAESRLTTISVALSEAKNELQTLEVQLGYDRTNAEVELMIAENKVNNYNDKITTLTEQLETLQTGDDELLDTGYLVVGNPSLPFSVLPDRPTVATTLFLGALAGLAIAWIAMNYRWLISGLFVHSKPEDDEE